MGSMGSMGHGEVLEPLPNQQFSLTSDDMKDMPYMRTYEGTGLALNSKGNITGDKYLAKPRSLPSVYY